MDGIFLRTLKEHRRKKCSEDGDPFTTHTSVAREYGWNGDICIFCPYNKKAQIYYDMSETLPLYIIHTLCERHFSLHNRKQYAKAKEFREKDIDTIHVVFNKRFKPRNSNVRRVRKGAIQLPNAFKRKKNIRSVYTRGSDLLRYVAKRTGSNNKGRANFGREVVVHYSSFRYNRKRRPVLKKVYSTTI